MINKLAGASSESDVFSEEEEVSISSALRKKDELVDELADLARLNKFPLYVDNPRGVILIRLKQALFIGGNEPAPSMTSNSSNFAELVHQQNKQLQSISKVYFIMKTSRMVLRTKSAIANLKTMMCLFDEIVVLKVGDKNDQVEVKMMREGEEDELLA